ncbi:DUF192 domain-containing protein [Hylemonella gracilis]|uniref:DUF192 domain-containing protein n=1 Tax=Hylemonella gracilis TaxID=80880 RepID=UPI0009DB1B63|nr:DUF192 domain-containing protein [Hylemonella gracilis]
MKTPRPTLQHTLAGKHPLQHLLLVPLRWAGPALSLALALCISLFPHPSQAEGVAQRDLPRTTLNAGMYLIQVQVASTAEQRATGLMYRTDLRDNEGMLFIFEKAQMQCFWMKNTQIPLTAAFIADDGTVVNTVDMQPRTTNSHCSTKPVRYVLEVRQGWLAQHGVGPGKRITGGPFGKN